MMNNQNSNGEIQIVYVGTYTNGESEGIYVCQLDMSTGELKQVSVARNIENPSYLAIDAERNRLYAVNELLAFEGHSGGGVSAFAIQPSSGELTFINQVPSHGGAPCYLSISQNGRYLLIANYAGGNISVIPVDKEGVLGKPTEIVTHLGSSMHPKRQAGPHPHAIILDSANDYAFVPDLGLDKVMQYRFDQANGRLNANQRPWVAQNQAQAHATWFFTRIIKVLTSLTSWIQRSMLEIMIQSGESLRYIRRFQQFLMTIPGRIVPPTSTSHPMANSFTAPIVATTALLSLPLTRKRAS